MQGQIAYFARSAKHFIAPSVLALLATLSGCDNAGSQQHGGMPPPEVSVITASPTDLPVEFEYTGETAGSREVEVRARVTGILLARNYPEGSHVSAGQSLFTIDPAPYTAARTQAQADVASARAKLDKAKRNTVRYKQLYAKNTISQQDYDDAVSNETIAEADLKAARARLTQAGLDLEYTRVESPIAGIAGRALRSEGNYVTGPEVLLTTVTQSDPIYVLFGIADEERRRLDREAAAGQIVLPQGNAFDVTVKLAEGSEYTQTGKLTFSDVRISGTTGTSEARAELPNPNDYLRPGQFVRVILKGAFRPGAILVPQRAVRDGPAGKFVYVVDAQNTAQARPVTLGDWQGDEWIVTSGLAAGDKVIVDGVMKIGPGAPVSIAASTNDAPAKDAATGETATKP